MGMRSSGEPTQIRVRVAQNETVEGAPTGDMWYYTVLVVVLGLWPSGNWGLESWTCGGWVPGSLSGRNSGRSPAGMVWWCPVVDGKGNDQSA